MVFSETILLGGNSNPQNKNNHRNLVQRFPIFWTLHSCTLKKAHKKQQLSVCSSLYSSTVCLSSLWHLLAQEQVTQARKTWVESDSKILQWGRASESVAVRYLRERTLCFGVPLSCNENAWMWQLVSTRRAHLPRMSALNCSPSPRSLTCCLIPCRITLLIWNN